MSFTLQTAPITFDSLFGSATFRNLASLGTSRPGHAAMLAPDGTGAFATDALTTSARGTRGSDQMAIVGPNGDPIHVAVDWAGATCALSGTLVGSVDPELKRCEGAGPTANKVCAQDSECTDDPGCSDGVCNCLQSGDRDTTLGLGLTGTLVNQPPTVHAGADQTVECNAEGVGTFTLHATGSDPDGNAHLFTWLRGGPTGAALGYQATLQVSQAAATTQTYLVRLLDTRAQGAQDVTHVQVVDTTPPVVTASLTPLLAPPRCHQNQLFRPSCAATDVCDPGPGVVSEYLRLPDLRGCSVSFHGNGSPASSQRVEVELHPATQRSACRVEVGGPTGQAVWDGLVRDSGGVTIGVPVSNDQQVQLDADDHDSSSCQLHFVGGRLIRIEGGCGQTLVCVGEDFSGNTATATGTAPGCDHGKP